MKTLVIRAAVAAAIVTGFVVTAEAQPVQNESVSISVVSSVSAVGVLAK